MAMFENFPYTNLHELNLDWLIKVINQIKDGQVISVNGMTGEVTLYEDASVQFPNVSSDVWNIVRNANNKRIGIAFHDNGNAYIIYDGSQRMIYDTEHQPPYPVTSVNGQTGNITLYSGASVALPPLTDEQLTNWRIFRNINSANRGLQFNTDGTLKLINGNTLEDVYTSGNPQFKDDLDILFPEYSDENQHYYWIGRYFNDNYLGFKIYENGNVSLMTGDDTEHPLYVQGINDPSDFTDPSSQVLELKNVLPLGSTQWGIIRSVSGQDVGLVFAYDNSANTYRGYIKQGNTLYQLITTFDIPSQAGVVSINTKTGIVTLYASEITINNNSGETVEEALARLLTIFAPSYDPINGIYSQGSFVTNAGVLYRCNTPVTTPENFDPDKWAQTTVANILASINLTLSNLSLDVNRLNNGYLELANSYESVIDGIAIVSYNNEHPAIAEGQYVFITVHPSLPTGLYKANSNIVTNGTLSNSNLSVVHNALSELKTISENLTNMMNMYKYVSVGAENLTTRIKAELNNPGFLFYRTTSTTTSQPISGGFCFGWALRTGNNYLIMYLSMGTPYQMWMNTYDNNSQNWNGWVKLHG